MKSKITSSIVLVIMLLSLVSLPATAQQGQQRQRFKADSGEVTLGATQILRITIVGNGGNDTIKVRFRWMQYIVQGCDVSAPVGSLCRHTVASQGVTPVETLGPDGALSFDLQQIGAGVRAVVESNSRKAQVLAIVFDTSTQSVVAVAPLGFTQDDSLPPPPPPI